MDWSAVRIVFPSAGVHPLGLVESSLINQQQFSFCRQLLHPTSSGHALMLAIFPIDRSTFRPDLTCFLFHLTFFTCPTCVMFLLPLPFILQLHLFPSVLKIKSRKISKLSHLPVDLVCDFFSALVSARQLFVIHTHVYAYIHAGAPTFVYIYAQTHACAQITRRLPQCHLAKSKCSLKPKATTRLHP